MKQEIKYGDSPLKPFLRVYKNRYMFPQIITPYVPLIMYDLRPPSFIVKWFKIPIEKIKWWFWKFCFKQRDSEYVMECLQDLYMKFGAKVIKKYVTK